PPDAIEVKANWLPLLDTDDPSRFHWNVDCDHKKWKLVAMHIITKAVPNWTWATFEHVDNPGRCDYMGCHDAFGATLAVTDRARQPLPGVPDAQIDLLDSVYPASASCVKTNALLDIFKEKGLDSAWGNYCLKGSQVDFTAATGEPTRLGNSVTEGGFV